MIKHSDDKPGKPKGDRNFDDKLKGRGRKSFKEDDVVVSINEEIVAPEEAAVAGDVVELIPTEAPKQQAPRRGRGPQAGPQEQSEFVEKVISINRITKVTKGGKKLSFSALVVVGDMKGKVGYNLSKAKEVSIAIRKALNVAKRNMVRIPMRGTTITHEIIGQCGASCVLLKPASEGTGVIASGPVRAVCDGVGIRDILTKVHRSNNPINVVKATIDALSRLKPYREEVKEVQEVKG